MTYIVNRKFLLTAAVLALALLIAGTLVFAGYHITITIDGKEVESEVPPQLVQDRTLVPIRVITEHFGADVGWVQETRTVEITSPYGKFMEGYGQKGMYIRQARDVLPLFNAGRMVILDVRADAHRDVSYITDSLHIPMDQLLDRLDELPDDQAIAVYCVKNINAAYAVTLLNMLGYDAYLLEDGINAWRGVGGQVTLCRR